MGKDSKRYAEKGYGAGNETEMDGGSDVAKGFWEFGEDYAKAYEKAVDVGTFAWA